MFSLAGFMEYMDHDHNALLDSISQFDEKYDAAVNALLADANLGGNNTALPSGDIQSLKADCVQKSTSCTLNDWCGSPHDQ